MVQKKAISAVLILILDAAAAAAAPMLPPGHPAGIQKAQLNDKQTIFIGVGVLALGAGLYLASGDYKTNGASPPPVTPPTTTGAP
ncbi:MAG TPA: hypothetical protein VG798_00120 [Rhizomicrobium sp.]|nr:hypothetical protein [Rhizomicrobium sp.]